MKDKDKNVRLEVTCMKHDIEYYTGNSMDIEYQNCKWFYFYKNI